VMAIEEARIAARAPLREQESLERQEDIARQQDERDRQFRASIGKAQSLEDRSARDFELRARAQFQREETDRRKREDEEAENDAKFEGFVDVLLGSDPKMTLQFARKRANTLLAEGMTPEKLRTRLTRGQKAESDEAAAGRAEGRAVASGRRAEESLALRKASAGKPPKEGKQISEESFHERFVPIFEELLQDPMALEAFEMGLDEGLAQRIASDPKFEAMVSFANLSEKQEADIIRRLIAFGR